MNEKDAIIKGLNTKIDDLEKNNEALQMNSEGNQELKNSLLEEQSKMKETQAKVSELTDFILARDETISQLKIEAAKSLEQLKALEENSNAESASQMNEIESLKKAIIQKVSVSIRIF